MSPVLLHILFMQQNFSSYSLLCKNDHSSLLLRPDHRHIIELERHIKPISFHFLHQNLQTYICLVSQQTNTVLKFLSLNCFAQFMSCRLILNNIVDFVLTSVMTSLIIDFIILKLLSDWFWLKVTFSLLIKFVCIAYHLTNEYSFYSLFKYPSWAISITSTWIFYRTDPQKNNANLCKSWCTVG